MLLQTRFPGNEGHLRGTWNMHTLVHGLLLQIFAEAPLAMHTDFTRIQPAKVSELDVYCLMNFHFLLQPFHFL